MNAAERANSIALMGGIAATVNLVKHQFPDLRVDMKPWLPDEAAQEWIDPHSIDIGFHFPGLSRSCACRSILMQIRFFDDPEDGRSRAIGTELAGYDHRGQCWRFSTVEQWTFSGEESPKPEMREKFKTICRQVFEVFNPADPKSA